MLTVIIVREIILTIQSFPVNISTHAECIVGNGAGDGAEFALDFNL